MKERTTVLLTLILLGGLPLLAGGTLEEARDADPDARIVVENLAGSVRIMGWEKNEMLVKAVLGDDADGLDVSGDSGYLIIEVDVPRHLGRGRWDVSAELEIWVPKGSRLEVETVSADIDASGIEGRLDLESVSGEIVVKAQPKAAELATVSGRIRFDGATRQIEAESVSGSLRLEGVAGSVGVSSVSGRIEVAAGVIERGSFESVSGSIELSAAVAAGARLDLESHSANVTLALPAQSSASFDVETFSGHIDNELGPKARRSGRHGPGQQLDFTIGSGDARISIETFSGNVTIRPR